MAAAPPAPEASDGSAEAEAAVPRNQGDPSATATAERRARSPKAAPAPEAAPGPDAAPGVAPAGSVDEAIRAVVGGGAGLPPGLGLFLRSARVAEENADSAVIELPPGPGMEMLEDPNARRALSRALSERLGRALTIDVQPMGAERAPTRLTPERVREDQVRKRSQEEPALDRAVREWDLELLD